MAIFAIGDLHLSLGTDKPMDIFGGWTNYTQRLEENWRNLITADDTVVIAGDISWAMGLESAKKDFGFIHALPGKKIILKGNHDYFWTTKAKMDRFFAENGFDSIKILFNNAYVAEDIAICGTRGWIFDGSEQADKKVILREAGRLKMSLDEGKKTGKEIICFLHYPPVYQHERCGEIMDVLHAYEIKRCFYGHIHGPACAYAYKGDCEGIALSLISADYLGFKPIKIY